MTEQIQHTVHTRPSYSRIFLVLKTEISMSRIKFEDIERNCNFRGTSMNRELLEISRLFSRKSLFISLFIYSPYFLTLPLYINIDNHLHENEIEIIKITSAGKQ